MTAKKGIGGQSAMNFTGVSVIEKLTSFNRLLRCKDEARSLLNETE